MFDVNRASRFISCALRREQTYYNPTSLQYSIYDADASLNFVKD